MRTPVTERNSGLALASVTATGGGGGMETPLQNSLHARMETSGKCFKINPLHYFPLVVGLHPCLQEDRNLVFRKYIARPLNVR
jgi:hypothetical protein